ncbi:universal stress protein PHOS34-like [Telopea speciosissima]|uniref:universal stress protein PHOS34-like n=1 Tax=Telopea speciosissima TaxID=54955 RepID=UPI001CC5086F|nr:universal stress protein PHOS34-like [Telopea speciosissima]
MSESNCCTRRPCDLKKTVILVGVDNSKESFYSLEWTVDHLLTPTLFNNQQDIPFKLILLHVKNFAGPGLSCELVEADHKRTASVVADKAMEFCRDRSISEYEIEVLEGDARNKLCEAVDKYHAHMLVVGSHGYGAFKRAILGSVSDYCAHHAHCSVLIVKKPKNRQNRH